MNCFPQPGQSHACGLMPVWIRSTVVGSVMKSLQVVKGPHTMSSKVTAPGKALVTSRAMKGLRRCVGATSPHRRRCWLHLRFAGVSARNIAHVSRGGAWGLPVVEGLCESLVHSNRGRMGRVRADRVVGGTRFVLHGWRVVKL